MTQEEFIKILDKKSYSYKIEGDKIVVTSNGDFGLDSLYSIPRGVEFRGGRSLHLNSLMSIPPGVQINNGGDVSLRSIIGGWFRLWPGSIQGIHSKRLLNNMISLGLFDKGR